MSFTVYKSSAGSGKTFTLVKEYLSIVLKNPSDFKHILAITFTNKAAAEMKNRVLQSLQFLAEYDNKNDTSKIKNMYDALLKKGLNHDEIVRNSKITLSNIIHNYGYFSIGTIDSFTHKIVKIFAFDLKMPLNFEVELEKQTLINQAVEMLISNIGTNKEITDFMLKFANSFVEDEAKVEIKYHLINLAKLLFEEENLKYIKTLQNLSLSDFSKIIDEINTKSKTIENTIIAYAKDSLDIINSKNIDIYSFYQKKKGLGAYLLKLSEKNISLPNNYVKKALEEDIWYSDTTSDFEKNLIDSVKSELQEKINILINYILSNIENYTIIKATLKNIYSLSLLNEIEKLYFQISHYDNVVHISEFSKSINEIINKEPIPYIYERVGERYKYFLIDEFQDTSILQWQNLLPLIDNSLSENFFNMIVGDGKQAIYRFRGGEVEQFAKLPKIHRKEDFNFASEKEESLIRFYKEENLNTNYRSKSNIIEFNNSFFEFLVKNYNLELINDVYKNHSQEYRHSNEGGGVMINFIKHENKNQYNQYIYEAVLNCIKNQISDGYQFKDITILCRSNSQAFQIANYLNDNSIKVISSDSLLLCTSPKVRLIVALLKYLNNCIDTINNANIIKLFLEIFNNDTSSFGKYLLQVFNKNNNQSLEEFFKIYNFNVNNPNLSGLSLYELCEKLIENLKFEDEVDPYLIFFMDAVYNYSFKRNNSLEDFIKWWDEKKSKLSLKSSTGINAVTVMTIHKSKGLEFPVVIYPFAESFAKNTKKYVWVKLNKDITKKLPFTLIHLNSKLNDTELGIYYEEERKKSILDLLNIVYVAFTRASERLYIFSNIKQDNNSSTEISKSFDLSKILKQYVDKSEVRMIDENNYIIGDFSKKAENIKSNCDLSLDFKNNVTNCFKDRLNISRVAPENWNAENPDQLRSIGTIIHDILAKSNNIDEISHLLDTYVVNNKINNSEKDQFIDKFSKLFSNPIMQSIVKNPVLDISEAEIISTCGKVIRPDRIICNENSTYIIDYKTGSKNLSHIKQLENYKTIITEMGYKNIKLCIVYLKDEPEIEIW